MSFFYLFEFYRPCFHASSFWPRIVFLKSPLFDGNGLDWTP